MEKKWIGIIGQNGVGKSTVCEYFENKGYFVVSLSDVVRQQADQLGRLKDRDSLTALANQMKEEHGLDYFAKCTVEEVIKRNVQKVVFDSVRHPDEIKFLISYNTQFIGVTADVQVRYQRIQERNKDTDFVTFDQFKIQDDYEMNGASSGQKISKCLNMCHYNVSNDDTLVKLYAELDDINKRV